MRSREPTIRRVDCIAGKSWQRKRSDDRKTKNLKNDWEVLTALAKESGWSKDEDNPRALIEMKSKRCLEKVAMILGASLE